MVDPPVQGVEIRAITEGPHVTEGFVVCLIPGSIFKPHRAVRAEKEYYFRVGDSNRTIPTGMLRTLFHPTFTPWLVPLCSIGLVRDATAFPFRIQVQVSLINRGMASAKSAFVRVESIFPLCSTQTYPYADAWDRRFLAGEALDCRRSIHPGETIVLLSNIAGSSLLEPPPAALTFRINFEIYADNAPGLFSEVTFSGAELAEALTLGSFNREGTLSLLGSRL